MNIFPRYLSYEKRNIPPSVLSQEFPLPSLEANEVYYPQNRLLAPFFSAEKEMQMFGASQFCCFLSDTIEVEHGLVIPAIASLRRIPYHVPSQPKQDLFRTATDEGFHAEQSLSYLAQLESHFGLFQFSSTLPPLFIRRLAYQQSLESNPIHKQLLNVLNGIVTETRISVELGKFAVNEDLSDSVRRICKTHAQDEVIHSSQFQALGNWLWQEFDERTKSITSKFFIDSSIARSLPDIDNIIVSFMKATGRTLKDSTRIVLSAYSEDQLINEMIVAAAPTINYLEKLGLKNYASMEFAIEKEREQLHIELSRRRKI